MRTTIEIDDQLYQEIKLRAQSSSRSIREVLESALRSVFFAKQNKPDSFRVRPHASKFRAGIDEVKIRQTLDEIDLEEMKSKGKLL